MGGGGREAEFAAMSVHHISPIEAALRALAQRRILVLDGAMGTMIQTLKLEEQELRGAPARRRTWRARRAAAASSRARSRRPTAPPRSRRTSASRAAAR